MLVCRQPDGAGMLQSITSAVNDVMQSEAGADLLTKEQVLELIDAGGSQGGSEVACCAYCAYFLWHSSHQLLLIVVMLCRDGTGCWTP